MKKYFVAALACLALIGCQKGGNTTGEDPTGGDGNKDPEAELAISQDKAEIKVGETLTLTANVEGVSWESSKQAVATVDAAGVVTGVAEGSAIIYAKKGEQSAKCMVKVVANAPTTDPDGVKGSQVWAVVLDEVSYQANLSKMAGDIRTDDTENFLYIWPDGSTYAAGDGVGKNAMGNDEGYVSLTVTSATLGWSGLGFCIKRASSVEALEALRQGILANPDEYFFHFALKSTDNASHKFYVFNDGANGWTIGSTEIDGGAIYGDYTRDGKWHEFDIPMSMFTNGLQTPVANGDNIFCVLSGNQQGAQLNFDAVYFYKK